LQVEGGNGGVELVEAVKNWSGFTSFFHI
jgi:hypothetical protein